MAFTQHGDQTYEFGLNDPDATALAASLGIAPTALKESGEPEFTASAQNETGETLAHVTGGEKASFTLSGFVLDEGLFNAAPGQGFLFKTRYYIVEAKSVDRSNQDFVKGELTGSSFPRITGATSTGT